MQNLEDVAARACVICNNGLYEDELDRYTCRPCQNRGVDMLRALPRLYRATAHLLQPGASKGEGRVTGSKSAPMPCSEAVLSLRGRGGLVTVLASWEDAIREELGFTAATFRGSFEQTLDAVAGFLINNAPWVYSRFDAVDEYHRELRHIHGQARRLVEGDRPERSIAVVCPCGAVLRFTLSTDGRRCGCGQQYGWTELRRLPLAERSAA